MCVKSLGVALGWANAQPPGLTKGANAPQLPEEGMGAAGIALFTDNISHLHYKEIGNEFQAKMTTQPEIASCPCLIAL